MATFRQPMGSLQALPLQLLGSSAGGASSGVMFWGPDHLVSALPSLCVCLLCCSLLCSVLEPWPP